MRDTVPIAWSDGATGGAVRTSRRRSLRYTLALLIFAPMASVGTTLALMAYREVEGALRASGAARVADAARRVSDLLAQSAEARVEEAARAAANPEFRRLLAAPDNADATAAGALMRVLTDIVMPHVSGPELARRLSTRRPEMRVLYILGSGLDPSSGVDPVRAEAHVLLKPFTPERLASKVRECLTRGLANQS